MRYFSNLTRMQNMGWEFKYFAILEIWQKKYKNYAKYYNLAISNMQKIFF